MIDYLKCLAAVLLLNLSLLPARAQERAFSFDELAAWQRITSALLSDDGRWAACRMEPWVGDASVAVFNAKGERLATFHPAGEMAFAPSGDYLLVTEKPPLKEVEALKLKKAKDDAMPMDRLVIYRLTARTTETVDSLKSYKLSGSADWLAYQRGGKKDSTLYVRPMDGRESAVFPAVSEYAFAKEGNILYYVSKGDTLSAKPGLYAYLPGESGSRLIREGKGVFKQVAFDKAGDCLAFLYCEAKDSTDTRFDLYLSQAGGPAKRIADRQNAAFPAGWVISGNERISFSDNARRLFFGIAPEPRRKDTTVLDENHPKVQVWKWDETTQYTQQTYNKERDLKQAYAAVYNLTEGRITALAKPELPRLVTAGGSDSPNALLTTSEPYGLEQMWTGRSRSDIYAANLDNGHTECILEGLEASVRISPQGSYAYWYLPADSSYYTWSFADHRKYRLTTPASFPAWDEDNDVPDYPAPHGIAGWTDNDASILLYDRYDVWQFDPTGKRAPVNLTQNGRSSRIRYRLLQLDSEQRSVAPADPQLLLGFNEQTKGYGYYRTIFASPARPSALLAGNFMLKQPLKAKKADALVYTVETFEQYPDLLLTNMSFKRPVRLTDGYRQQQPLRWGTAEPVTWLSLDGRRMEGVVYKPAGFDPQKKYPLMVNFYERNAETLYSYRMPEPHRSTIDYHFYNSHGYVVFNPDVAYTDGYPGESSFNCVMPGISALVAQGYIDEQAIGVQGHSWGAYQIAYLTTRTRLFAAAEAGAPVVNMFSAYGGIRWGSGLNRSFQYEHTQSRIGGSIWEMPLRYFENSPLFEMDKVQTPLLIMHNDQDGHVPWYQGIEYFVALKRLRKPAWLLNYTGEIHWPMRMANRIDFQKRMFQFFEHYLRKQPMPQWMNEGVPAVDQDFELGY